MSYKFRRHWDSKLTGVWAKNGKHLPTAEKRQTAVKDGGDT